MDSYTSIVAILLAGYWYACINSALPNVLKKGLDATPNDVEKYCDCALRKIIDEDKEFKASTE
ncbi:MAG TPA: hypothetical protein ACN46S_08420, partial [Prochlorococcus sp.]